MKKGRQRTGRQYIKTYALAGESNWCLVAFILRRGR